MEEKLRNAKRICKTADMFKHMSEYALSRTFVEKPAEECSQTQRDYIDKIKDVKSDDHKVQELLVTSLCSQWEDHPEYLIPFAVNAAFACELYMKAILTFEGKQPHTKGREGHNLQRLFADLSDDLRSEIEKEHKLHFEDDFGVALSQNCFAFDDMRYWYEKTFEIDVLFLEFFCEVLCQVATQVIR